MRTYVHLTPLIPVWDQLYVRRFFPDGTMLYCTSPASVASVAKAMAGPSMHFQHPHQHPHHHPHLKNVFLGRCRLVQRSSLFPPF